MLTIKTYIGDTKINSCEDIFADFCHPSVMLFSLSYLGKSLLRAFNLTFAGAPWGIYFSQFVKVCSVSINVCYAFTHLYLTLD